MTQRHKYSAGDRRPEDRDSEVIRDIGGSGSCSIPIDTSHHCVAILARRGERVFLRDVGTGEDVLVNGEPLPSCGEQEVTRYDDINVAGTTIVIGPELFFGHAQVGIDTTPLRSVNSGAGNRILCDGIFLRARPSTLTAIVGPAGCGKTVFLNMINGYKRPDQGSVIVGEEHDLHAEQRNLRSFIGFVPQDDVMIPELTVRQSLDYRLRLRFPDMAVSIRDRLIHETCRQLGIPRPRIDAFLDTVIGSAESGKRGLSGGERRRANIAHELLLKPVILILDEPTSGLSSVDADHMVELLRNLASKEHITVIATIHQPSQKAFGCFDDLLVMASGGRTAYYGPARDVVPFFERATETPCSSNANPAEFILDKVFDEHEVASVIKYYESHKGGLPSPLQTHSQSPRPPVSARPAGFLTGIRKVFTQVKTLVGRNIRVILSDRPNMMLTLGQVPVLALLVFLAFINHGKDGAAAEAFTRKAYIFSVDKRPYQKQNEPVPVDALAEKAVSESSSETDLISRQAAQRRGAIYFLLVAAGVWFGMLGGCREIVAEKHILKRESMTCVEILPYLLSKFTTQALQTGVQTAILVALVSPFLLHLSLSRTVGLWIILWLVAATSAALGLAVSCVSPTLRVALTAVPLVMIPQLLFGGIMRPLVDVPKEGASHVPAILSMCTVQRWGFESALHMDSYASGNVMIQEFASEVWTRYASVDFVQFREGSILDCFFGDKSWILGLLLPIGCLATGAFAFVAGGYSYLRKAMPA